MASSKKVLILTSKSGLQKGMGVSRKISPGAPLGLNTALGTVPEIEPKTSRADSDVLNHYANWPVWLKIMTSQAEQLPCLQSIFSKNAFCAETLFCSTIAVENSLFMTSQDDSSFNNAH